MSRQVSARLDRLDMRPDGGANVFFKVRLGDYLVNVPMTIDNVSGLNPDEIAETARQRLHELAKGLVEATKRLG